MNERSVGRLALLAAGVSLGLALGGCGQAGAGSEDEAKAQAEAAAKQKTFDDDVARDVECLNAVKWQSAAIEAGGIGGTEPYHDHYQAHLEKTLGTKVIAGEAPKPMLSRGSINFYLDWAYPEDVKTKFSAGQDANGDGKVSAAERSAPGFTAVRICVLNAAAAGAGPLASADEAARQKKVDALKLRDKGA